MKAFRRGFVYVFGLCVLLTATLTAVRAAGTARPPAEIPPLMSAPDGQPCFPTCLLGIQPGITSMQEAQDIVAKHPLTARLRQSGRTNFNGTTGRVAIEYVGDGPTIYVLGYLGRGVQSVGVYYSGPGHLGPPVATPRIADLMLAHAQPPVIELGFEGLLLNFGQNFTVAVAVEGRWESSTRGFDPGSPIVSVGLYAPDYKRVSARYDSMFTAWRGFASIRTYVNRIWGR